MLPVLRSFSVSNQERTLEFSTPLEKRSQYGQFCQTGKTEQLRQLILPNIIFHAHIIELVKNIVQVWKSASSLDKMFVKLWICLFWQVRKFRFAESLFIRSRKKGWKSMSILLKYCLYPDWWRCRNATFGLLSSFKRPKHSQSNMSNSDKISYFREKLF